MKDFAQYLTERKSGINEAKKIPKDKALKAIISTFESLNKESNISVSDLRLKKVSRNKWLLTSTEGGDMTIDNKTASELNVTSDTKGEWRLELHKWKATDMVDFLKKQGVKEVDN